MGVIPLRDVISTVKSFILILCCTLVHEADSAESSLVYTMHITENKLYIRIYNIEPVLVWTDATVYVWLLGQIFWGTWFGSFMTTRRPKILWHTPFKDPGGVVLFCLAWIASGDVHGHQELFEVEVVVTITVEYAQDVLAENVSIS